MAVEVISFTSTEVMNWDIIGGGVTFGPELQPNADLSGTGGIFTGPGAGIAVGVIADTWLFFTDGGAGEIVTGLKTAEDAQTITMSAGTFNGILASSGTKPVLTGGTLYRARLILTDVVGVIRWFLRDNGSTEIEFAVDITEAGIHDMYFVASSTLEKSNYLNFNATESSVGISEFGLQEVFTTKGHLAIAEDDGDGSYIEATGAQTAQFDKLFMTNIPESISGINLRHISRRTGGSGTRIFPNFKLNSGSTMSGTSVIPGTNFNTFDNIFLVNLDTGENFTRPEINGIGSSGIEKAVFPAVQFQAGSFPRMTYGAVLVTFEPKKGKVVTVPIVRNIISDVVSCVVDC